MMRCPLCGKEFEPPKREGLICSSCPMSRGCGSVCCPNCGYSFPVESKVVNMIKKIVGRSRDE
jgi:uncharacterized protein with PIN domain